MQSGNPRRLTRSPGRDSHASWTPDGKKIVFGSARSGSQNIWIMNADGSDPWWLTTDPATQGGPEVSPDGRTIAFFTERGGRTAGERGG
jgi:TolB protein